MVKKWKVFIVTHKVIRDWYYEKDKKFNKNNWGFINVSENKLSNAEWYTKYDSLYGIDKYVISYNEESTYSNAQGNIPVGVSMFFHYHLKVTRHYYIFLPICLLLY